MPDKVDGVGAQDAGGMASGCCARGVIEMLRYVMYWDIGSLCVEIGVRCEGVKQSSETGWESERDRE